MNYKAIRSILLGISCLIGSTTMKAQENIKYGPNYIVFEAEDTNNGLESWVIRTPTDPKFLSNYDGFPDSPPTLNDAYLEYTGPFANKTVGNLTYTFIAPKTATFQLGMRLHSPILTTDKADKKNDVFIKMEGNFTSAMDKVTTEELETLHKFFGRGKRVWGTGNFLEHKGINPPLYNLIKGEEYTFTMNGRSPGTSIDYIAFFEPNALPGAIKNRDLATQLAEEIRPYLTPTSISLEANQTIRTGTDLELALDIAPLYGNPNSTWSSSNDAILEVDQNGIVTAKGAIGETATITAVSKIDNSLMATSQLEIIAFFNIPVTSVTISSQVTQIVEGTDELLSANTVPESADNNNINWLSSDTNIATVDENGNVTALAPGNVTIKAVSAENDTLFDEKTIEIVAFIANSVDFDIRSKYLEGTYHNIGNMEVSIKYEAGSLNTIETPIRVRLRRLNDRFKSQHNVDVFIPETVGTTSGTATVNIPLDGLIPSEDLPEKHFYQLQILVLNSAGKTFNSVLGGVGNPVTILDKSKLSVDKIFFTEKANLYPNPADDRVFIDLNTNINNSAVSIYSVNGVQVYHNVFNTKNIAINTSNLTSGMYILKLKNGNSTGIQKLIIK